MKRALGLTLSFLVCFSGLVLLTPAPARTQEVASVGNIVKLREQYEQLLAVDRDPSTPTEVREVNRTFLKERRAQLAQALRNRLGALRKYQAGVAATLTDDEKRAVEGSIQKLADELKGLEPASVGTRPSRVVSKTAQSKQVVPASFDEDAAAAASAAPDSDPKPARKAGAIEITSPDRDKTVHVGQIEVEVSVGDEDVDDIMVAVYTPGSGQKPATARSLELKRSDHGKKTFPLALEAGANRIEVSDLKRNEVLATRTLTYTPTSDVLNSAPQAAAAQPIESLIIKKLRAKKSDQVVICGQLQLASLNRTFALIRSTPALGDLAARFRPAIIDPRSKRPADPRRRTDDQIQAADDDSQDFLVASQLSDKCEPQTGLVPNDGLQRSAAIDLLEAVLLRLDSNLQPKDIPVNTTALDNETSYILESTTTSKAVRAAARSSVQGASRKGSHGLPPTSSAFSSLSADTIRKQIVLLQQYLGNVEVLLTHKDSSGNDKVIDQTFADRDGNFVFTIDKPANDDDKEYSISTEGDEHFTRRTFTKNAFGEANSLRVNLDIEDRPVSLLARSLIGYDQSGAAAAKREFTYFFDFYVSKSFPFRQVINPDFGERLRLWGDFRINSVPQTADATIADFAGTGFVTGIQKLQVNQAARVFESLGGIEYRLTGNNALLPSFDRQTKQKFSLSLIGAFGFVTPIDQSASTPTIFKVFDDAPGLPPEAKGKEFVAFIPTDRDRFFRQYYAGLRVQTFFFNKYNVPLQRFPAQFDVTVGQNEFVTGGRLHGPVLRMEGFFPLPYDKLKFINLFATAQMIPGRPNINTPLRLTEAPAGTTFPASNVLLLGVPQPNRDHYRIGIAFDAIPLVRRILQPPVPSAAADTTPTP
ncbi:MAG: hypothetical protein QOJ70_618 [Acidobacteriota bacterium]|jgi:hypothetical protein|nr:hypothetical protein [Acidobacteriota bacterium]